jgi:hypothetical protein
MRVFAEVIVSCLRLLALALVLVLPTAASAADAGPAAAPPPRLLGFDIRGGVLAHDPWSPEKRGVDLTAQVLAPKPFRAENALLDALIPRATLGGSLNLHGRTSHAYAGLTWAVDLTPRLFLEGTLGIGGNNGDTGLAVGRSRSAVGCSWNFYEAASVGYRLTATWSILATVEHISNAGLCDQNRGVTNLGARIGYSF